MVYKDPFLDLKRFLLAVVITLATGSCMSADTPYERPAVEVDQRELYAVVQQLTRVYPPRNYYNVISLDQTAGYIYDRFAAHGYRPVEQRFNIDRRTYKNILAFYGPEKAPRFVLGAHYDVCGEQPGADDNASAVAGLLAVAGLFKKHAPPLDYRIDFVAYTLEEPPVFRSKYMGSYIHAKSLYAADAKVWAWPAWK